MLASLGLALALAGGVLPAPTQASAAGAGSTAFAPDLVGRFTATSVTKDTTITNQPDDLSIGRYGTQVKGKFTVTASGLSLSYKWQRKLASGGTWKTISGATSRTYSAKASSWASGTRFRVVVKGTGGSVISSSATLTVLKPTKTPAKDAEEAFGLSGITAGVDLSAYQYTPYGKISMSKVADRVGSDGFAILRNGSGARPINHSYTDACTLKTKKTGSKPAVEDCAYTTLADRATSNGLSVGHYWFNGWIDSMDTTSGDLFAGGYTPTKSAITFVNWLTEDGNYSRKSTDPLVLDIEAGHAWTKTSGGKTYTLTQRAWKPAEAVTFINKVKSLLEEDGYEANLYVYMSANAAATTTSSGAYKWADVAAISRLWVASWGTNNGRIPTSEPKVGPWASYEGWSIWQYTSNMRISGDGVGAIDGDIAKDTAWTPKG